MRAFLLPVAATVALAFGPSPANAQVVFGGGFGQPSFSGYQSYGYQPYGGFQVINGYSNYNGFSSQRYYGGGYNNYGSYYGGNAYRTYGGNYGGYRGMGYRRR